MKRKKYEKDLPRRMYLFFKGYCDAGAPSFLKFAHSIGATLADIERWKNNSEFMLAYSECSEIRRDYLIDNALAKKQDASMTKFILSAEYRMGESEPRDEEKRMEITLEVLGE